MRVEQWRLGSLSSENGADITFEEIKDDEDEAVIYFYACECMMYLLEFIKKYKMKVQNLNVKNVNFL